jgi:replicative DNA helicase
VNYYSVGEALENANAFDDVRTKLDHLRSCFYFQKTFKDLEFEVLEAWRRRAAIEAMQEEVTRLMQAKKPTEVVFSELMARITKISDPLLVEDKSIERLIEHIAERAIDPRTIYGLETGLRDFDKQTHGLQKQEVFLLSGQPGAGKSILAAQLAFGMATNGHPGVFYSLEMSPEALYMRHLSAKSGISTTRLKEGWDMVDELDSVHDMLKGFMELPITVRGQIGWSLIRLRSDIARLKYQSKIEFVVIDYLDLISDPSAENDIQKSENISRELHNMALEFDVAVLVIQSLVKAGYNNSPGMENISGSHKVSYNIDQGAVLVGDREEKIKELKWIKVRHADDARGLRLMLKKGLPEFVSVVDEEPYN